MYPLHLRLIRFQHKLQGVEIGIHLLFSLFANQPLRHLKEACQLSLEIYGQLRTVILSSQLLRYLKRN